MNARIPAMAVLILLSGLAFLIASCSDEDEAAAPPADIQMAHQAEAALLDAMAIENGAVVPFVGPVPSGWGLSNSWKYYSPTEIFAPDSAGHYYLFFVNDHPDSDFHHPVRYACLDLDHHYAEAVDTDVPPTLVATPPDTAFFQRSHTDTVSGVIFYYGHGGGAGFPQSYLP